MVMNEMMKKEVSKPSEPAQSVCVRYGPWWELFAQHSSLIHKDLVWFQMKTVYISSSTVCCGRSGGGV